VRKTDYICRAGCPDLELEVARHKVTKALEQQKELFQRKGLLVPLKQWAGQAYNLTHAKNMVASTDSIKLETIIFQPVNKLSKFYIIGISSDLLILLFSFAHDFGPGNLKNNSLFFCS